MILVSQKRVVMGLSLSLLLTPMVPLNAKSSDGTGIALCAAAIGVGIAGLCGLIYACSGKSNEQILDDAQKVLRQAHAEGRCFYTEYMNVFESARYGNPTLEEIERNFLEPVVLRAHRERNTSVNAHIDAVRNYITALEKSLKEVRDAIDTLQSKHKKYERIYDNLVQVRRDIDVELAYLNAYYKRFADHHAYFALYELEAKLYAKYQSEIALPYQCPQESYQFEKQLLHIARAHDVHCDYPLVKYHDRLRDNIAALERDIRELKYWYATRGPAAKQLLDYLVYIRNLITDTPAFKEERERKKDDDARKEMIALREREVQAQATMAMAASQQAQAAVMQAQAAQHQAYVTQARLVQQPTVVVVHDKC